MGLRGKGLTVWRKRKHIDRHGVSGIVNGVHQFRFGEIPKVERTFSPASGEKLAVVRDCQ